MAELAAVRAKLAFLVTLKGTDIEAMVRDGNKYAATLDKAQTAAELTRLVERINKLAAGVQKSLSSVDSEKMAAVLEGYAAQHPSDTLPVTASTAEWITGAMVQDSRQVI